MIEGLKIIEDYITEEEEMELLSKIRLTKMVLKRSDRNNVTRYGSDVPYNSFMKSKVIPTHFLALAQKLVTDELWKLTPDSISVNDYRVGQEIKYHRDSSASGEVITTLSLLGDATMGMMKDNEEHLFNLKRRTLVQMEGEARWKWQHCIQPVTEDRLSIVFRKGTKV